MNISVPAYRLGSGDIVRTSGGTDRTVKRADYADDGVAVSFEDGTAYIVPDNFRFILICSGEDF